MNVAVMAFLYAAIAASTGALAFLAAQRMSGRTPREVQACYEKALLLESASKEVRALCEDAEKSGAPEDARADLRTASEQLEDAIRGLRRGADLIV